jgi:N6-adenosine-specific RNA methylase IME4
MPLDWIRALPVGEWADRDAHLYLWVPARFNREGIGVLVARAWGFECISEIVWAKPNFGLGKFPRPQHEILLICRRGTLPYAVNDVGSVQHWRRDDGAGHGGKIHSAKPAAALDLIERASPPPYLELFARPPHRLGWDVWGNESANTAALEVPA